MPSAGIPLLDGSLARLTGQFLGTCGIVHASLKCRRDSPGEDDIAGGSDEVPAQTTAQKVLRQHRKLSTKSGRLERSLAVIEMDRGVSSPSRPSTSPLRGIAATARVAQFFKVLSEARSRLDHEVTFITKGRPDDPFLCRTPCQRSLLLRGHTRQCMASPTIPDACPVRLSIYALSLERLSQFKFRPCGAWDFAAACCRTFEGVPHKPFEFSDLPVQTRLAHDLSGPSGSRPIWLF